MFINISRIESSMICRLQMIIYKAIQEQCYIWKGEYCLRLLLGDFTFKYWGSKRFGKHAFDHGRYLTLTCGYTVSSHHRASAEVNHLRFLFFVLGGLPLSDIKTKGGLTLKCHSARKGDQGSRKNLSLQKREAHALTIWQKPMNFYPNDVPGLAKWCFWLSLYF